MTNHIDLTNYKLQRIIDGNERYSINTGSLSPLAAREIQRNLAANKKSRKIIYTTPNGDKFSVLVDERQFQELSDLRDGKWRLIESLKSTKAETRKPASGLRQLGLIMSYCQIWCSGLIQAAIRSVVSTSMPSLNGTPVITLAR